MSEQTAAPRRRENTRQRLLEAAGEVFAEIGLDAASVEAICERAGFTRGAFYSNFDSKEELLLALSSQVAEQKLDQVSERVRRLTDDPSPVTPHDLVQSILEPAMDERIGVLLTNEIRTRAMRDRRLAATYLAWQQGMTERVAVLVEDLADAQALRLRLPALDFARVMLEVWEETAVTAVIAELDYAQMCALVGDRMALLASALIDPR